MEKNAEKDADYKSSWRASASVVTFRSSVDLGRVRSEYSQHIAGDGAYSGAALLECHCRIAMPVPDGDA